MQYLKPLVIWAQFYALPIIYRIVAEFDSATINISLYVVRFRDVRDDIVKIWTTNVFIPTQIQP